MTVVDDIKARLDILEVVGQRVPLQRSGRSYKANCPFHEERTPSFHVFPDRQSWRCFGACATGGDVIGFVMRAENQEFGETLRQLAQQTGVKLDDRRPDRPPDDAPAFQINELARAYFQRRLASTQGAEAREYLEQRGLNRTAVDLFELGLAPRDGESLRQHLAREGFSPAQLVEAGVVRAGDDGAHRDLFRGRLMFPIRDADGRLAGFGGRAMDGGEPKYLNSPQGQLFDKGRLLYGMNRARDAIRRDGAVIVEGYMDAIAAHQAGFANAVASMGTALTERQVALIRRLTGQVTMALDQDEAGQQATLRSLESSWHIYQSRVAGQSRGATLLQRPELPEIRIAALPDGQDPDEVIRRSPEEFSRLLADARPLIQFVIEALAARLPVDGPEGKAQVVESVFPLIAAVPDAIRQDYYFQMLAERLQVPPETLRASIGRMTAARRPPARTPAASAARPQNAAASPFARLEHDPLEEYCLALLLRHPELAGDGPAARSEFFQRHENREIFDRYVAGGAYPDGETAEPALREQLARLQQKELRQLDGPERRRALAEVTARLEERSLRALKADEQLRYAESPTDLADENHYDAVELNRRLKANETLRRRHIPAGSSPAPR